MAALLLLFLPAALAQSCAQTNPSHGVLGCASDGGCMTGLSCYDTAGTLCSSSFGRSCAGLKRNTITGGNGGSSTRTCANTYGSPNGYCGNNIGCAGSNCVCTNSYCSSAVVTQGCTYDYQCSLNQRCVAGQCRAQSTGGVCPNGQPAGVACSPSTSTGNACGCTYITATRQYQCCSSTSSRCQDGSATIGTCDSYTANSCSTYGYGYVCQASSSGSRYGGCCRSGYGQTGVCPRTGIAPVRTCTSTYDTTCASYQSGMACVALTGSNVASYGCCTGTSAAMCPSGAAPTGTCSLSGYSTECQPGYSCVAVGSTYSCCPNGLAGQYMGSCRPTVAYTYTPPCDGNLKCLAEKGTGAQKCMCEEGYGLANSYSTSNCVLLPALDATCDIRKKPTDCGPTNSWCKPTSETSTTGKCECLNAFGYVRSTDSKTCVRGTKKYKDKCTLVADCMNAFSTCTGGECVCKTGFSETKFTATDGTQVSGCAPTAMKCPDGTDPIQVNAKPKQCEVAMSPMDRTQYDEGASVSFVSRQEFRCAVVNSNTMDSCDTGEYCNAYYDDVTQTDVRKGYCCKEPTKKDPKCPVGDPWASSKKTATDGTITWDCDGCPTDYFCHFNIRVSEFSVCCPKPCDNPLDTYKDGNCYPPASYGEACDQTDQCNSALTSGTRPTPPANGRNTFMDLVCDKPDKAKPGTCKCPVGAVYANGVCNKVNCNLDGRFPTPVAYASGNTIICDPDYNWYYNQNNNRPPPSGMTWGYCQNSQGVLSKCVTSLLVDTINVGVCCMYRG